MILALFFALSSFHWSTLEEYYIGGLFLGPGNGITDGSLGIFLVYIIMGIFGNEWTKSKAFGGFEWCELFAYGIAIGNFVVILLCIKGIIAHSKKTIKEGEITGEPFVWKKFII